VQKQGIGITVAKPALQRAQAVTRAGFDGATLRETQAAIGPN
jgi:hypothetical protein